MAQGETVSKVGEGERELRRRKSSQQEMQVQRQLTLPIWNGHVLINAIAPVEMAVV